MDDHAEGEPRSSNNNKAGDSDDVGWYENSEGLVYTTLEFATTGDPGPSQPRGEDGNSGGWKSFMIQRWTQPFRFIVGLLEGYNRVHNHSDSALVY